MAEFDYNAIRPFCRDDEAFRELSEKIKGLIEQYESEVSDLKTKEEYLRLVLDYDPNFIFVRDQHGHFVLVNQSLASSFDLQPEEIIGKRDSELLDDQQQIEFIYQDDQAVLQNNSKHIIPERKITDVHGKERWLRVIKTPLALNNGSEKQILAIGQDITEQKTNSIRFKRLKERYEALLLSKVDFIWVIDTQSSVNEPSKSWMKYTGQNRQEMMGTGWMDAFHIEDRDRFQRKLRQSFDTLSTMQTQCRIKNKANRYEPFEIWAAPVLDDDFEVLEWMVGAVLLNVL